MCKKCGCNSCETDNTALILKESRFVHISVSDGLKYHIDNKIPLNENIYRIGSKEYMKLYEEARSLYSRNKLDVNKDDKYFLTETHIGNFGLFEGKKVPLDIPMLHEDPYTDYDEIANDEFGMDYDQLGSNEKEWVQDQFHHQIYEVKIGDVVKIDKAYGGGKGEVKDKKGSFVVVNGSSYHESDVKLIKESFKEIKTRINKSIKEMDCWDNYKLGSPKTKLSSKTGKRVNNCVPKESMNEAKVDEAEFKGKEVALGKPKRGGPKAYYVYVKDGDKVKKVTFGSGGLRAKIKNKDARSAFAARHNCDKKKDRTTAGYWSCNLPKYAKQLGLGANMNTYW